MKPFYLLLGRLVVTLSSMRLTATRETPAPKGGKSPRDAYALTARIPCTGLGEAALHAQINARLAAELEASREYIRTRGPRPVTTERRARPRG